ncbi:MAG: YeeE/YedE family protein [Burkholderiaceae bacterium]
MLDDVEVAALQDTVVWSAFGLAFVLGAVMNRTNFCTMGAVSDILNIGDWTRMRMWMAAIGVAIISTQGLAAAGLIDLSQSLYTGPNMPVLSYVVGGFLFGVGMVLASGCGSKTLIRLGGGSLKSLVVFVMLALAAYMTLRGVFAPLRVNWLDQLAVIQMGVGQDLPRIIGGASVSAGLRMLLGLVIGGGLIVFALASRDFRRLDPILASVAVGAAITGLWWISGSLGYVAEHPETLEQAFLATNSGRPESFTFVAPIAYTVELLLFWTDTSRIVTVGIAAVLGMIAGSFAYAVASRGFRFEGFSGPEDTANHLVGGILMGIGGVTAVGCTVGQGLTGLSTLAAGSLIAFVSIVIGAVAAIYYQIWRVEQMV